MSQRLLRYFGICDPGHPWVLHAHRLRRKILRSDEHLWKDYLQATAVPKLHIGGGWYRLDGWLNTDLALIPGVMVMDATARFPFADETFQFVYSEHMIEHVSFEAGKFMLQECCRVLRPGGRIRVTTPDLGTIIGLYGDNLSECQEKYLSWFCGALFPDQKPPSAVHAINAHFRLWGHQFLYNEKILSEVMELSGFQSIERFRVCESHTEALQNLENTERYPSGLLDFESMALEAVK